jgi:hypothetical protein
VNLRLRRRLEAVAAADRGDHQVQRGVLGVAALVDEIRRGLVADADLDEVLSLRVVLAEVQAQSALAFVKVHHDLSFRCHV